MTQFIFDNYRLDYISNSPVANKNNISADMGFYKNTSLVGVINFYLNSETLPKDFSNAASAGMITLHRHISDFSTLLAKVRTARPDKIAIYFDDKGNGGLTII